MSYVPPKLKPYSVLLVDRTLRLAPSAAPLFASGVLKPSGQACDYAHMLEAVQLQEPDVIVLEISEDEDAFEAIEAVMAEHPTPILVLHPKGEGKAEAFRALALGALDVAEAPNADAKAFWPDLARKVALLAQVRVVQHVKGKRRRRTGPVHDESAPKVAFPVVAIAASLGGPRALSQLLRMIPEDFGAPICVCQHITDGFSAGLAQWLSTETKLKVAQARDKERMAAGTVYLAPSGFHLLVRADGRLRLDDGPPLMGFRPSCDALLSSTAEAFGKRAIGVVLTGMGKDGARGLKEIRRRGGHTLAQDEASCVVFGMPREAVELGAAERVLPLEEIAAALVKWVDAC